MIYVLFSNQERRLKMKLWLVFVTWGQRWLESWFFSGGGSGIERKNVQARYRSPWPIPTLRFNIYPELDTVIILLYKLWFKQRFLNVW